MCHIFGVNKNNQSEFKESQFYGISLQHFQENTCDETYSPLLRNSLLYIKILLRNH